MIKASPHMARVESMGMPTVVTDVLAELLP